MDKIEFLTEGPVPLAVGKHAHVTTLAEAAGKGKLTRVMLSGAPSVNR